MNKGIIGALLVAIVVLAVVALFIKNTQPKELHPWKLLPDTPAMVIETNNPGELYEKLKYGNDIWKSLTKFQTFNKLENQIGYLDSLFSDNSKYHESIFTHPLLIALYADSIEPKTLFVSSIDEDFNAETIKSYLNKKLNLPGGIFTQQESGFNILRIINSKTGLNLSIGFAGNMMVVSRSENLVKTSLKNFSENSPHHFDNAPQFVKLKKTAGKKVSTHLYINGKGISKLLEPYAASEQKNKLFALKTAFQWSETDLYLKKNELVLNGLSIGNLTNISYTKAINQKPQIQDYTKILPDNTTMFIFRGFSNFKISKPNISHKQITIDIDKLTSFVNSEVIFASTAHNAKDFKTKSFIAIRLNDKTDAQKLLNDAAKKSGKLSIKTYNRYRINKLHSSNLLQILFGDFYDVLTENYYVFIDDYVIFSNNANELSDWVRMYEEGKTLDLNGNFKPFSKRLTETSNLTLFLNIRDLTKVAGRFVNKETDKQIEINTTAIKDFEGALLQLCNQNPFIFTNLFVKQGKNQSKDNSVLWKVKLEDDITGKPYPVKDHTTGRYNIMVFDKSQYVYLINYDGNILWKKQIKGLPASDVFQVDYFKNGKLQYLFNSAKYFYLFDKNGNSVKHYPVKINPSATNGVNVVDFNNKKDYRLIVTQSDKHIYDYDIKGRKVRGWKTFKLPSIVTKPVQHLVTNHKDYLFVTDINNNIKILNRRGSERIKIKGKLNKAVNSNFYVNKTNGKGLFITTNEKGELVYISSTGKLRYTNFGKFSPNHYFIYEDFDGNGSKDFVFVDGNKLTVFDRFKKVLLKYTFKYDIQVKPVFFNLAKNKRVLAVVSNLENTIYLFDKNGNTNISKGLMGETPITIISLKNNREINLITGSGNTLLNYRIK